MTEKALALFIKTERKRQGMSAKDMFWKSGYTDMTLYKLERTLTCGYYNTVSDFLDVLGYELVVVKKDDKVNEIMQRYLADVTAE